MQALLILAAEHRLLRRLLSCLETLVDLARRTDRLDGEATHEALALLESFADGSHQDKEELHLFPRLASRVSRADARRLARLCRDHEAERRSFRSMRLNLEGACYAEPLCLDGFVFHARAYIALQRKHMAKENLHLLPLAERVLGEADDARLVHDFRQVDERSGLGDAPARVARLCRRLSVDPRREPTPFELHPYG